MEGLIRRILKVGEFVCGKPAAAQSAAEHVSKIGKSAMAGYTPAFPVLHVKQEPTFPHIQNACFHLTMASVN